jgi:hypothetical protein
MIDQDQSQAPLQNITQGAAPPQQQQNQLGQLAQGAAPQQPMNISKHQLISGLHHLGSIQKALSPLLRNPAIGLKNIRPKLFDAMATLIGQGTMSVPEVINGMKDLPDDPLAQKKWLESKVAMTMQAEQKLVNDYISQGPGAEPEGPDWSMDNHKDHMAALMGNYKRG